MSERRSVAEGILAARLEKLEALRREGRDPYAIVKFDRTHTNREVVERFEELEGRAVRVLAWDSLRRSYHVHDPEVVLGER